LLNSTPTSETGKLNYDIFWCYFIIITLKRQEKNLSQAGKSGANFFDIPDYKKEEILCIQRYPSGVETVSYPSRYLFWIIFHFG